MGPHTRRVALALLALLLHAALAGATHFHRIGRGLSPSPHTVAASPNGESAATFETAGHAQCLLCRLQRDLASGLSNAGPATIEPPPSALPIEAVARDARRNLFPGVAHGRAPPTHA